MRISLKFKKEYMEICGIILFLFLITFIFLLNSPLHIWISADIATDSSVFKTVALMMGRGYMPYRDSFDHKGPLIYLINFLGMRISSYRGVWVIEFISLFITFGCIYKIARLCCGKILSCVTLLISTSLLFDYFQGGNLVEEYAMPFIAVSLFIFLDYFINGNISKCRLFLCGFGLGAVCLLRLNMIAVWVVFSIAVFVEILMKHNIAAIKEFLLFFLLGFFVIVLPILLWLLINHSFQAFIDDYINFNLLYSSAESGLALPSEKWRAFFFFFNNTLILFTVIISAYLCKTKNKFLYGNSVIYLLFTILTMCLSGTTFAHYGMILVPAVAFPIASLFHLCAAQSNEKAVTLLAAMYLLGVFTLPKWLSTTSNFMSIYEDRDRKHYSELVESVCNVVVENTTPEDFISVYGSWDIIYVVSNRPHATQYSYLDPISSIRSDIINEYYVQLEEDMPRVIVRRSLDERINEFAKEHHYETIWNGTDSYGIPIYIFKRTE